MDFTINTYKQLLKALHNQGFVFQTFEEYLVNPLTKCIILRHDVDKLPFFFSFFSVEIENYYVYYRIKS